jgi:hypothetical protein
MMHIDRETFDKLWASAEAAEAKRATDMPTEQDAITAMFQAYLRLKELGWNDPIYCPKDGSSFDVIEAASSGIHKCHYQGEWPTGSWWVEAADDLYPSRPTLYRVTEAELAKREQLRAVFRESVTTPARLLERREG